MKTAILSLAALLLALQAALHAVEVRSLRCEYLKEPLGIDVEKPRLSWMTEVRDQTVEVRGLKQTAYQVLVASTPELLAKDWGDLWDSGKVASDQSIQVEYAGKMLESRKERGNLLEIDVANRWPNRVLGDQQPPDNDVRTVKWPSGLLGGPEFKTGRYTFATAGGLGVLLPSGLLGPVRITAQGLAAAPGTATTISNLRPRRDVLDNIVDAHDGCLECFKGKYYLYGTRYGTTNGWGKTNRYVCYSSPDLLTWTPHGEILKDAPPRTYYRPYPAEAREIASNGLDGMLETWKKTGTLFENWDQEKPGAPGGSSKADFVGWSGVQPIATLMETIIGIKTHAPENKIKWTLRLTEKHGVRKLKWGPHYSKQVELIADARANADDAVTIHVDSKAPFTLEVDTGFATKTFDIRDAGRKTLAISTR
jgi:hypothetical protein